MKLFRIICMGLNMADKLLMRFLHFSDAGENMGV
jgi:hypothetical protein